MSEKRWQIGLCALLCLTGACMRAEAAAPAAAPGFAVVELFTSEGCSSCPPADEVLSNVTTAAEKSGQAIYTLAFHVNYWDSSEWRDPFSSSFATQHQKSYAAALRGRGLYTPQMIVNGRDEFIGSQAGRAEASINEALARPSSAQLQLEARAEPGRVVVDYKLAGAIKKDSAVRLALVQAEGVGKVAAGENAGRTLRHVHVVRAFDTLPVVAAGSGSTVLTWPAEVAAADRAGAKVIAYLQERGTLQITAATQAEIEGCKASGDLKC
jgi:hypothetical protein